MNTVSEDTTVNGFNTTALGGLANLLKEYPEGGRVTFHSATSWKGGAHVLTQLRGYSIDGELRHQHERRFTVNGDEPSEFGAADSAPAPPEMLMHAVANCILATTNAYAALQGISLTHLEATLESDVDLHGMFGLDDKVRPGFGELRARISIAGDADQKTLEELAQRGVRYSPIRDSVQHGVPMKADIQVQGA